MKVLLVSFAMDIKTSMMALNPNLEYVGIVVEEPESVKKILQDSLFKIDENIIYPFYELKECIENLSYDVVIHATRGVMAWSIHKYFIKYGLPREKFIFARISNDAFSVERAMRYYREHSSEFQIIATGISYSAVCLDESKFKYKLFNFARSSQDLYYDFQIAKFALSVGKRTKYVLIGLAPYSFHHDLSKTYAFVWRLLPYFNALNDLHNFWMPKEKYRALFHPAFLDIKLGYEGFDETNVYGEKLPGVKNMDINTHIKARDEIEKWTTKNFPESRKENIKIFDEYLKLCERKKVQPIIFLPPMTEGVKKYFNREILEDFFTLVNKATKKHSSAIFFNGWDLEGFSNEYFYDMFHLNLNGAAKFSKIFNTLIEQIEGK